MNATNKCKHCGLVNGIHLIGCPNYQPPAKRSPIDDILNFTKGGHK